MEEKPSRDIPFCEGVLSEQKTANRERRRAIQASDRVFIKLFFKAPHHSLNSIEDLAGPLFHFWKRRPHPLSLSQNLL
jgi:hypothetical protein